MDDLGIPKTIAATGVDEKKFIDGLPTLAERAFDDQCTTANPRYPLVKELAEIYRKAYYGK
jgi:acetaldehyde dehydrogenase/alcohol dehydrogenase